MIILPSKTSRHVGNPLIVWCFSGRQYPGKQSPSGFLSQGNGRDSLAGRFYPEGKTAQIYRDNGTATGIPESYRCADLRRSPSTTLPSSWKKPARVGVKKSVSFSSDTSFQEKKSLFSSKTHVHEAKVYHKGVLQGQSPTSAFPFTSLLHSFCFF